MKVNIILTGEITELQSRRFSAILKDIKADKISCYSLSGNKLKAAEKVLTKSEGDIFLFFGNEKGRYLAMSAAAKAGMPCFTDVLNLENGRVHRKVYSTHADGFFKLPKKSCVLVLLPGGPVAEAGENFAIDADIAGECSDSEYEILKSVSKPDLGGLDKAKVVFVGGRGLKKKENFELLIKAGEKCGAAVGCTRAAALSGWTDYSRVVGVSGTQISPEICILFGVSGAAPFLFGIENAGTVIAINKDKNAPVFDAADYGIIKDCISVVKELAEGE